MSVAHGAVEGSLLPLPRRRRPVHQERDDGDVGAADEVVGLRRVQARTPRLGFSPFQLYVLSFRNVLIAFQTQFLSAADAHSL